MTDAEKKVAAKFTALTRKLKASEERADALQEDVRLLSLQHTALEKRVAQIVAHTGNIHDVGQNVDLWMKAQERIETRLKEMAKQVGALQAASPRGAPPELPPVSDAEWSRGISVSSPAA